MHKKRLYASIYLAAVTFCTIAAAVLRVPYTTSLAQGNETPTVALYVPFISKDRGPGQETTPTATTNPAATSTPTATAVKTSPPKPSETPEQPDIPTRTVRYATTSTNILNPERGFHDNIDMVDETDLSWVRNNGYTLARSYIRLDSYRNQPLPDELLNRIERGFNAARTAGIKLIPRFSYNFGMGEDDASIERVQAHIAQLQPLLQRHADVIAVMQAGFIGAWGEWHSSTNNLDTPENRALVLGALLESVPVTRMVQLRYPGDLIEAHPQALTGTDAFNGSKRARTAHHNDCFLANEHDAGTYFPLDRADEFKGYLDAITPYVAVGGETCQVTPEAARTGCDSALADLERFHWDYLNGFFFQDAIDRWKREGCHDEIARRLGYRYRLIEASAPISVPVGSAAQITVQMTNEGFGKLYNPRRAELVFRPQSGGDEYKVILSNVVDPRMWLPQPGATKTLTITANLPAALPTGAYDLLLRLPDAATKLRNNPAYAIQFANQEVWEASSGSNRLNLSIDVIEKVLPAATSTATATATGTRPPNPSATSVPPTATPTATSAPPTATSTATVPPMQIERWSAATTWGGSVPQADQAVIIPVGKTVLLDVSPPTLRSLTINGTLIFDRQDLALTAGWILVQGRLEIGTASQPFTQRATITLNGPATDDVMGMGGRFLGAMAGGTIDLYGAPVNGWTRLNATANEGDTQITLATNPGWRVGDHIVIASTDFDYRQAEAFTISAISGSQIMLDSSLKYMHWGTIQTYSGQSVDERAEVGLLNRTIVIQGDASAEADGFGGHSMIMNGGVLHADGVEFYRMGQRGRLARYPIHFHLMGEDSRNSFVKNSSIHRSFNRCLTIHGSNGVLVQNNVAYDAPGHCYFLEDGAEFDNVFEGNLGLGIYRPEETNALLGSDTLYLGPAVYWITNPDNVYRNNVAAGSQGTGYWIALPEHPTGPSFNANVWPRWIPFTEFRGNVSHSNGSDGLHVDRGPDGGEEGNVETTYYAARQDPTNGEAEIVTVTFADFLAFKNRGRGVWLRGNSHLLLNAILADNAIGATFASQETIARDNLYVGETANVGTPEQWMIDNGQVGVDGRTLPLFWQPDFTIRGFEFYDGMVGVEGSYFARFEPNAQRQAAALSYLDFTAFAISNKNFASDLTFHAQTNRVYLATRPRPADPTQGTEDGYRSAVFLDSDGSVTGTADRYVVVDNPFLHTGSCDKRTEWNAWVCNERYVGLSVRTDSNELASVSLTRETGGATHTMFGTGEAPSNYFRTMLMPEQAYTLTLDDHVPSKFRLVLHEGSGHWVHLHISYSQFPRVLRYGSELAAEADMNSLAAVSRSGFFYDGNANILHIKLLAQSSYEQLEVEAAGPPPPVTGSGTGLTGTYYPAPDFGGTPQTRVDAVINYTWFDRAPLDNFPREDYSVRWTGQVQATNGGSYTFTTVSDDGVRLWVCEQQLIDDWRGHGPLPNSGIISLSAGQKCPIVLEFFQGSAGAMIQLWWEYGGFPRHVVPQKQLYAE